MARWLCLFLSICALAGLLASTPGNAFASDIHHARHAHHDCCPGTQAHHGQEHNSTTLPGCCVVGFCACQIAAPSPSRVSEFQPARFSLVDFVALRHDDGRLGQSRPPDLRPPIA